MLQSMGLQTVRHDLSTEQQQLYSRKANNPLKIGKELEQTFLQRKYTKSKWIYERLLKATNHKKVQIKTRM